MPALLRTALAICTVMALFSCSGEPAEPTADPPPEPPVVQRWQAFTIDGVRAERAQRGVSYFEFIAEPALRMGLYHLPAGAQDNQDVHAEDEVYYVVSGSAQLRIDGVDHDVVPGAAYFVRAQVPHRFHSVTDDLDVFVVFASGSSNPTDPAGLAFAPEDMVRLKSPSTNVWDPFLQVNTLSLGMYMLPRAMGGDGALTHTFDEINIVVGGRSQFEIGSDRVDIEPGSIVYVERGLGHSFSGLSEDVDVLILWNQ